MNTTVVRLNAIIHNQREEIRHLQFVVRQLKASAIETGTAETEGLGPKDESAPEGDAQKSA